MEGKADHGLSKSLDELLYFFSKFIYQLFSLGCYLILRYPHAFHDAAEHMFWKKQINEQDIEVVGIQKAPGDA